MSSKVNFSLTQLEYVLAVHKYGHFAKAAEACHVTQPTLSMQIQKLEESLGATIFDRTKKPILLTDAGQQVIAQIQTVLFEARKIEGLILMNESDVMKGTITVGVIPTVAPYLLPKLLPMLEEDFSALELQIKELQTHQIVDALDTDEIDVGILAIPLGISKLFERQLYFEPFSVLCRRDHELSSFKKVKHNQLKANDIWLLQEGHCLRNQVLDLCGKKIEKKDKKRFHFESGSLETLKNLVGSYGGYTLVPALASENVGRNVSLIPFERPIPAREIGVVYRREHYKAELIEALCNTIVKCIPDELRKIKPKDLEVLPVE